MVAGIQTTGEIIKSSQNWYNYDKYPVYNFNKSIR